ncbi:MAG: hypothetical protein JWO73_165 [Candidatus Taylorbacteria bacterium]|nr:hypothetical protein [Candidatus Taylorbacteria bacterium]
MERRLSPQALKELAEITREEFGETMSEDELEEMGVRLLGFFKLLAEPSKVPEIRLSEQESAVIAFIRKKAAENRNATVRGIAQVLGFRSSRSGQRALDALIARGLASRNDAGALQVREDIPNLS